MVSFSAAYQSGPPVIKEGRIGNLEAATCTNWLLCQAETLRNRINNSGAGWSAAYDIGVYCELN